MPGQRYRQAGFWKTRWGHCEKCKHVAKYNVNAKPGQRLRHQRCEKCGAILGRCANLRAGPHVKAAAAVERLAKRMGYISTP